MSDPTTTWHILTGEYPPRPGGVSDYTARLAEGLARRGREVHVWTRRADGAPDDPGGVAVHRLAEGWSPADFRRVAEGLDRFPGPRRLLVQYAPNAFGWRGMNVHLGRWLRGRRRLGDDVRVMFHEVAYYFALRDKPARWVLATVHRLMARDLLRACTRAYISNLSWGPMLRGIGLGIRRPIEWLPIPSNIEPVDDEAGARALRARLAPGGGAILGVFSTYAPTIRAGTRVALRELLRGRPDRVALLLGRGGPEYAAELVAEDPGLAGRLHAPGDLGAADLSRHIQACDLMIQYYIDGASARRTTLMALLDHRKPVASTFGNRSEALWRDSGALRLTPADDPTALARAAEALLGDPAELARLGEEGWRLYRREFAPGRMLERLDPAPAPGPAATPAGPPPRTAPDLDLDPARP
jgi:glycosyltransferase involved in cell wall biosynthesis